MVTITKLLDGDSLTIIQVFMQGGDPGGELVNEVLIDPAELDPPSKRIEVQEIMHDFVGFDATISFGSGLVDQTNIWVLPGVAAASYRDFRPFGNFRDRSGLDGTGKLQISTKGFLTTDNVGSILLRVRKRTK